MYAGKGIKWNYGSSSSFIMISLNTFEGDICYWMLTGSRLSVLGPN